MYSPSDETYRTKADNLAREDFAAGKGCAHTGWNPADVLKRLGMDADGAETVMLRGRGVAEARIEDLRMVVLDGYAGGRSLIRMGLRHDAERRAEMMALTAN